MYIEKTPGNTQSQSHEVWRTCGCTYIHIYTHMQIYIHMHIYIYTYIHLETLKVTLMKFGDVWFYIYMCIWIYVYAYIYTHTHLETLKVGLMKFGGRVVVHADHDPYSHLQAAGHVPCLVPFLVDDLCHVRRRIHALWMRIACPTLGALSCQPSAPPRSAIGFGLV